MLASGAHFVPITVPVLSPEGFLAYTKTLPFKLPVTEHSHARAPFRSGIQTNLAGKKSRMRLKLPGTGFPAVSAADCGIFAQDYGQAGAIDFFGRRLVYPES